MIFYSIRRKKSEFENKLKIMNGNLGIWFKQFADLTERIDMADNVKEWKVRSPKMFVILQRVISIINIVICGLFRLGRLYNRLAVTLWQQQKYKTDINKKPIP